MVRQVAVSVRIGRPQGADAIGGIDGGRLQVGGLVVGVMHARAHRFGLRVEIGEDANHVVAEAAVGGHLRIGDQLSVAAKLGDLHADHARGGVADDRHAGQPVDRLAAAVRREAFDGRHQAASPASCFTSFTAPGAEAE
jgi:hypothetical protein